MVLAMLKRPKQLGNWQRAAEKKTLSYLEDSKYGATSMISCLGMQQPFLSYELAMIRTEAEESLCNKCACWRTDLLEKTHQVA